MIARDSNSPRSPSSKQARESRQSTSTDCRDSYVVARHDRLIASEAGHDFGDDLPNQPGVIALVGINGAVEAFQFISFRHSASSSQTGGKNNADQY